MRIRLQLSRGVTFFRVISGGDGIGWGDREMMWVRIMTYACPGRLSF